MLDILYRDEDIIAINKPHGLLVHRSKIAQDASEFALQLLRDQIQQTVYPAHRLDRKTGGVLLFALSKEMDRELQNMFATQQVDKKYLAVLRGFSPESGEIDYPLRKENGTMQDAVTHFETLRRSEIDLPFGRHETSRYSLVMANPKTGRMHQLRKHFAHILHPIIGDRPHGCNKQNRLWKERFDMDTMMLHAGSLAFVHPKENVTIEIIAPLHEEFRRVLQILNIQYS